METTLKQSIFRRCIKALKQRPLLLLAPIYIAVLILFGESKLDQQVEPGTPIELSGICVTDPEQLSGPGKDTGPLMFSLRREQTGGKNSLVHIRLYGETKRGTPRYGDRLTVTGRTSESGPGGGMRVSASAENCRVISSGHGSRFKAACFAGRRGSARLLSAGIESRPDAASVIKALLLGYRSGIPLNIRDAFTRTGTLHIFAISGLHVGIIAFLMTGVLRRLRISRPLWALFIAPALVMYTVATGARPSAVRACVMTIIYFSGFLVGRKPDIPSAISAAALLILLFAPGQLREPGFIFSFTVVTGIVILYPLFERPLKPLWEKDPFDAQKDRRGTALIRAAGRYTAGLAALSLSAWLSSAPLTAFYFGRMTPISLFSNMLVIPAALAIVFLGSLSILIGACWILPGMAVNQLNLLLTSVLTGIINTLSKAPFGSVDVSSPGPASTILVYALIFIPALYIRTRSPRK